MIRVCLHSENLSAGCMTHSIKNIAKYIDKERFEVFLASADRTSYGPEVLPYFKPENILTYPREPGWMYEYDPKTGEYGPPVDEHPLYTWLLEKKIDIIHDNRSGTYFFPLSSPKITAKKIEYNIFGGADLSEDIAKTICISRGVYNDWVAQMKRRAPHLVSRAVMINPAVSLPETDENLREELGISEDTIVIGRSSNAGRGDTFNFLGFREIEDDRVVFLSPATDVNQERQIKEWGIKRIIILPTILNYKRMSMYYNTLDISAHHRGESFGGSVAEACLHGKPVVTAGWCNRQYNPATAQEELIYEREYCAEGTDERSYSIAYGAILRRLINGGREYCREEGRRFKERAMKSCAAPVVVKQLETLYEEVIGQ